MNYLAEIVGHPVAFVVSLFLSGPFVWFLAQIFFRNIAKELRQEAPCYLVETWLPGWTFVSWPFVKLIYFLLFSAAVITLFYQLCAWVAAAA